MIKTFNTIKRIIILIILFYEFVFIKTKLLSIRLKKSFKSGSEIFFMLININSLFIFIIIKNNEKNIHYNEIFKFLNITSKFKIKIIIYNIELIFNENHIYIFNWFQDFLNIFSKFLSSDCVTYRITLIKNNIDNYHNKFFKLIN